MKAEIRENVEVLKEVKTILGIVSFDSKELQELCDNLGTADFHIALNGAEYRFIHETEIEDIFAESVQEMIEGCYGIGDLPGIISCHIDWDGIVQDCMVDGYGHHFSTYNGSVYNAGEYYIFRTN